MELAMESLRVRSKDNVSISRKPRVYFTCHPDDFADTFSPICEDLFRTHDCAVYHAESMVDSLPPDVLHSGLERMNLFVIPVSRRLLTQPNRAMDVDFPYARRHHIPVLPIVTDPDVISPEMLEVYSREDRFGELQFVDRHQADVTAVDYKDKLRNHLDSTLTSDNTARRIRDAFDAYIFLSYRKKDRAHANELMRLVHEQPELRDVALWYDEFLVPGESFRESIDDALRASRLFMLLVTPNVLEEPDGKPNFVMAEEYPTARDAGMDVLPVEMVDTNHAKLKSKFKGIPACVLSTDKDAVHKGLLGILSDVDLQSKAGDPEHDYLMGLAYLDGIDMEVDRDRAVGLIGGAADAGLIKAMNKLKTMYQQGQGVDIDLGKALDWQRRIVAQCEIHYGPDFFITVNERHNLASSLVDAGAYEEAASILERLSEMKSFALLSRTKIEGEAATSLLAMYMAGHYDSHLPRDLTALSSVYFELGQYQKALDAIKRSCDLYQRLWEERHPENLSARSNLAIVQGALGDYEQALYINEDLLDKRTDILGEGHADTLASMNELGLTFEALGDSQRALELTRDAYRGFRKALGDINPRTLTAMGNYAGCAARVGDGDVASEMAEQAYGLRRRVLGERHPDTLAAMVDVASNLVRGGRCKAANDLYAGAYQAQCETLGESHPDALTTLSYLAASHALLGEHDVAGEKARWACEGLGQALGEGHPLARQAQAMLEAISELREQGARAGLDGGEGDVGDRIVGLLRPEWRHILHVGFLGGTLELLRAEEGEISPEAVFAAVAELSGPNAKFGEPTIPLESLAPALMAHARPQTQMTFADPSLVAKPSGVRKASQRQRAYDRLMEQFGERDPRTLDAMDELAEEHGGKGELREELRLRERSYELRREVMGDEHEDTIAALTSLAQVCDELEDYSRALFLQQREHTLKQRLYGETDRRTLRSLADLALTYGEQGNFEKECELLNRAYDLQCQEFGDDDPDARSTLVDLEYLEREHPELFEDEDDEFYEDDEPYDEDDLEYEDDFDDEEDEVEEEEPVRRGFGAALRRFFGA